MSTPNASLPAAALLNQAQALLRFQQAPPATGSPAAGAAEQLQALARFAEVAVTGAGVHWAAPEQAAWARVCQALVHSAVAQAQVALRDGGTGPITQDLAALLRDAPHGLDESEEIDIAVRWWQQARAAGLPVDADFGETWRALEWVGVQQHLLQLAGPLDAAARGHRLGVITRVALRYGPLKPLVRLLQPLSGAAVGDGYTF